MIIWLTALGLMALLAWIGYFRGAIRVAISLVGIVLAAFFAAKLGPFLTPLVERIGTINRYVAPYVGPVVVFLLVSIGAKLGAMALHQKIFVWYQYKALDVQRLLWERLNARLGLCLGLVNGFLYFVILVLPFQPVGYLTAQMGVSESDPRGLQIVNQIGKQLEATGLNRGLAALSPMPAYYYEFADIAGLLRYNPLLQTRVSRYPLFLTFAEKPEFQALANDVQFAEMLQRSGVPISEILQHEKTQVILNNHELVAELHRALTTDAVDFRQFLETGKSEKYGGEAVLGWWSADANAALAYLRKSKPNISPAVVSSVKLRLQLSGYPRWILTFSPDNRVVLRGLDLNELAVPIAPGGAITALQVKVLGDGKWQRGTGQYVIEMANSRGQSEQLIATLEKGRLNLGRDGVDMVFVKED